MLRESAHRRISPFKLHLARGNVEKDAHFHPKGLHALVNTPVILNASYAMIISCPACSTRYVVPDNAIGIDGRTVRCAKCKHSWFQDSDPLDLSGHAEEPAAKPAPPPPAPPTPKTDAPAKSNAAPSINHWRTEDRSEMNRSTDTASHGIAAGALRRGMGKGGQTEDADDVADAPEPTAPKPAPAPAPAFEEPEETPAFESDEDPLAEESVPDEAFDDEDYDDQSQFDYVPPFSARRNPLKMWTLAAAVFALMATGTVVAVNYYGLPDWFPLQRPTFGVGQSDLTLDFPGEQQRTETLETGEEIFRVRGTISNSGRETMSVPTLLVVFRDGRDRNVGDWVIVPSKRELAPGESLNVTEAIADIPAAATEAEIGWSPA